MRVQREHHQAGDAVAFDLRGNARATGAIGRGRREGDGRGREEGASMIWLSYRSSEPSLRLNESPI